MICPIFWRKMTAGGRAIGNLCANFLDSMPKDTVSGQLSPSNASVSTTDEINKQLNESFAELKSILSSVTQAHAKCEDDQQSILNLYDKIKNEDQKLSNYHRLEYLYIVTDYAAYQVTKFL